VLVISKEAHPAEERDGESGSLLKQINARCKFMVETMKELLGFIVEEC